MLAHRLAPLLAFGLLPALALVACSSPSEVKQELAGDDGKAGDKQAAVEDKAQPADKAEALDVEEETEDYSFAFSYPVQAAAIPELRQQLDKELADHKGQLLADAREGRAEAEDSGFPFNPYGFSKSYEVVADLPRFLSLSADFGGYTGGAHGYYGSGGLVWDREVGRALEPATFFTSPAALEQALGQRYCKALNRERAKKRADYDGDMAGFDECVGIEAVTLLLGSSDRKHFTRIGLIADPYVAGPYSEGSYEVTLKVDKAVLDAVKPEYREYFAIPR